MPEYCVYIHVFNGMCAEDHCLWCAGMCLPRLLSTVSSLHEMLVFHDMHLKTNKQSLCCKKKNNTWIPLSSLCFHLAELFPRCLECLWFCNSVGKYYWYFSNRDCGKYSLLNLFHFTNKAVTCQDIAPSPHQPYSLGLIAWWCPRVTWQPVPISSALSTEMSTAVCPKDCQAKSCDENDSASDSARKQSLVQQTTLTPSWFCLLMEKSCWI